MEGREHEGGLSLFFATRVFQHSTCQRQSKSKSLHKYRNAEQSIMLRTDIRNNATITVYL